MAQGVDGYRFRDACRDNGALEPALQPLFEKMVPALHATARIDRQGGRRKHPEPTPGLAHLGVFGIQRMGRFHATALGLPVGLPLRSRRKHLVPQGGC